MQKIVDQVTFKQTDSVIDHEVTFRNMDFYFFLGAKLLMLYLLYINVELILSKPFVITPECFVIKGYQARGPVQGCVRMQAVRPA